MSSTEAAQRAYADGVDLSAPFAARLTRVSKGWRNISRCKSRRWAATGPKAA